MNDLRKEKSSRLVRLDYLLMLGLMLFYALFAFYRLGSMNVPESGWYVNSAQESIVLDMGKEQPVKQMYVYNGWIDRRQSDQVIVRDFVFECSKDGEHWEQMTPARFDTVFMWKVFRTFPDSCRYIRLTSDDGRLYLNEIALFGENESERYSYTVLENSNPTAVCVADEPDKVKYDYSWYETTYFDEIYHPRTAYETITQRYPYENTHPPLGKNIIACGILLFGMNPFGWRFFGALCGVLMVPLVYVLGKKIFKQTKFAFMAACIYSFDFMHLSQTRMATIDSYTAFFVMGMYLFMFIYLEQDIYETGVKKSLWPLLGSGICFGLGAATKWQGIYAGIGLAVLFFYNLFRRYMEYEMTTRGLSKREQKNVLKAQKGKKGKNNGPLEEQLARLAAVKRVENFPKMAWQTILAGFAFFVVVPGLIYYLSYVPLMLSENTGSSFFLSNQSSMYNYHSTLKATHYYSSAWWKWPLDLKPLYLYSPNRDFVPEGISMGITTFGNPLVWWMTIPMVVWGIYQICKKRTKVEPGILVSVIGFFSLYAPWMLVSRASFIYHFFPCVIFVVILTVFFFREQKGKFWSYAGWVYVAGVFVLFIAFYPVLTGMAVPTWYVNLLRWSSEWVLG
ncbi:MAG: phospholipid carrier-dependent glycosyltransferase [Ruminococcaceae bacterium]|nr:phospholipid carrier-dependent glycosyltransferase [Oscillospiraceae bacterium]